MFSDLPDAGGAAPRDRPGWVADEPSNALSRGTSRAAAVPQRDRKSNRAVEMVANVAQSTLFAPLALQVAAEGGASRMSKMDRRSTAQRGSENRRGSEEIRPDGLPHRRVATSAARVDSLLWPNRHG